MRCLAGGSFDMTGEDGAKLLGAVIFCCALAWIVGSALEWIARTLFRLARGRPRPDACLEAQHQLKILHRGARGAFAQIIELGDKDGLPARLVGEHMQMQLIRAVERERLDRAAGVTRMAGGKYRHESLPS